MRYYGRVSWLWCCFGVLLAGCAQVTTATGTPTAILLSLPRPTFTPTPILRLLRTPTLRGTSIAILTFAPPASLPAHPESPSCYETPVGSLWCLGSVRNTLKTPIGQLIVVVYLLRADGAVLAEKQTLAPLTLVMPGEFSPYGVLFDSVPPEYAGPGAALAGIQPTMSATAITVRDVQTDLSQAPYHVTGTLFNNGNKPAQKLSVVATLLDEQEHVTGFRQLRLPAEQVLTPGATLAFALDAIPQGLGTARVEVSAAADE